MRQMNQQGWMHNRARMISSSFLTKHLLVDWRLGERYFMNRFIDGDLASNNGGWRTYPLPIFSMNLLFYWPYAFLSKEWIASVGSLVVSLQGLSGWCRSVVLTDRDGSPTLFPSIQPNVSSTPDLFCPFRFSSWYWSFLEGYTGWEGRSNGRLHPTLCSRAQDTNREEWVLSSLFKITTISKTIFYLDRTLRSPHPSILRRV